MLSHRPRASRRTSSAPRAVVREFISRINRRDVDRLTQLLSNPHVFIDSLGARLAGDPGRMSALWAGYFQMVPDYRIRPTAWFVSRNVVLVVGEASGRYRLPGARRSGGTWSTPAVWRAVVRRGRIAEWQVYADNEPIRELMRRARGKSPARAPRTPDRT